MWRDGDLDDDEWLGHLRAVYSAGFTSHWAVGRIIRGLRTRIGLEVAELAYVNAARCQIVENPLPRRSAAIKRGVVVSPASGMGPL